jgi:hypothetical protein
VDENGVVIASSTDHLAAGGFFPTISSTAAHLGAYCHFSVSEHAGEVRGYALIVGNAHLVLPAFAVGGAGAVLAITPAVSSVEGDATVCAAQNLDGVARMVDAELVDTAGTVIDDGSVMVQPGRVRTVAGHTEAGTSAVCRFTFANPSDSVRGFITRSPRDTFTSTPTRSATVTRTARATATASTTGSPTATPTAAPTTPTEESCVGDCSGDGAVTIDELITLVTIGLGAPLADCPAGDRNGDGDVTIEELVTAVGNALNGCTGG